jgi:hypothetical protein
VPQGPPDFFACEYSLPYLVGRCNLREVLPIICGAPFPVQTMSLSPQSRAKKYSWCKTAFRFFPRASDTASSPIHATQKRFAPEFLRFIAIHCEVVCGRRNLHTSVQHTPRRNIMFSKFFDVEKLAALSLSVLITGLSVGGVAKLADNEYNRVEASVRTQMQQDIAASKYVTRSGAVQA